MLETLFTLVVAPIIVGMTVVAFRHWLAHKNDNNDN